MRSLGAEMAVSTGSDWQDDPNDLVAGDDDLEDDVGDLEDELTVEVAMNHGGGGGRLACIYTRGMWWLGLPELYITPPSTFDPGPGFDWGRLAFVLASALITLGHELIEIDHFELAPYQDLFDDEPVELWLAGQEAPEGLLAIALENDVDTVIRVECSLWGTR
jgi:hypothetical protein